ncbi:hypothetical protein ACIBO5_48190 [Nonomuraea angiospora]
MPRCQSTGATIDHNLDLIGGHVIDVSPKAEANGRIEATRHPQ